MVDLVGLATEAVQWVPVSLTLVAIACRPICEELHEAAGCAYNARATTGTKLLQGAIDYMYLPTIAGRSSHRMHRCALSDRKEACSPSNRVGTNGSQPPKPCGASRARTHPMSHELGKTSRECLPSLEKKGDGAWVAQAHSHLAQDAAGDNARFIQ